MIDYWTWHWFLTDTAFVLLFALVLMAGWMLGDKVLSAWRWAKRLSLAWRYYRTLGYSWSLAWLKAGHVMRGEWL